MVKPGNVRNIMRSVEAKSPREILDITRNITLPKGIVPFNVFTGKLETGNFVTVNPEIFSLFEAGTMGRIQSDMAARFAEAVNLQAATMVPAASPELAAALMPLAVFDPAATIREAIVEGALTALKDVWAGEPEMGQQVQIGIDPNGNTITTSSKGSQLSSAAPNGNSSGGKLEKKLRRKMEQGNEALEKGKLSKALGFFGEARGLVEDMQSADPHSTIPLQMMIDITDIINITYTKKGEKDPETRLSHISEATKWLMDNGGDSTQIGHLQVLSAKVYLELGAYGLAHPTVLKAAETLRLAGSPDIHLIGEAIRIEAEIYEKLERYDDSASTYEELGDYYRSIFDPAANKQTEEASKSPDGTVMDPDPVLRDVFEKMKDSYEKALAYSREHIRNLDVEGRILGKLVTGIYLDVLLWEALGIDSFTPENCRKMIELIPPREEVGGLSRADIYMHLGEFHIQHGDGRLANEFFFQAADLYEEMSRHNDEAGALKRASENLLAVGEMDAAFGAINMSLNAIEAANTRGQEVDPNLYIEVLVQKAIVLTLTERRDEASELLKPIMVQTAEILAAQGKALKRNDDPKLLRNFTEFTQWLAEIFQKLDLQF